MKATIDIPDDLYRSVKAKASLEGTTVRDDAPEWFGMARSYAQRVRRHGMASVRRSIAQALRRQDGWP